jgi:hypothetical protein
MAGASGKAGIREEEKKEALFEKSAQKLLLLGAL